MNVHPLLLLGALHCALIDAWAELATDADVRPSIAASNTTCDDDSDSTVWVGLLVLGGFIIIILIFFVGYYVGSAVSPGIKYTVQTTAHARPYQPPTAAPNAPQPPPPVVQTSTTTAHTRASTKSPVARLAAASDASPLDRFNLQKGK